MASLAIGTLAGLQLLALDPKANPNLTYALLGAFVFFGGAGAVYIYRLKRQRPVLVLNAAGLTLRLAAGRPEHVDWTAITDVHISPAPSMHILRIARRSPGTSWADRAAFWRHPIRPAAPAELAIPAESIAAPLKKIEKQIRRRVPL